MKGIGLLFVTLLALENGAAYQGRAIFDGIVETTLRLLTPMATDGERSYENKVSENRAKLGQLREMMRKGRYDPDSSSYFDVIPEFQEYLQLDQEFTLRGYCFKDFRAISRKNDDGSVSVTINLHDGDLLCGEGFIVATGSQYFVKEVLFGSELVIDFKAPQTPAEIWDLYERGPRIFVYRKGLSTILANLASTLFLFEPCLTTGVGEMFAKANLDFLRDNAGIVMEPRPEGVPEILLIDKTLVQNGDTFDIMRLDGLDPMIAWAQGSATGHTAIALWKNEVLYLCESNALSPYWPTNGIQCNTYEDWMEQGRINGYNVVWVPLKRDLAAAFNISAAWDFVEDHLGIDYGWEMVLMGILDTESGNEVCVDSQKENCIRLPHWEMVFSIMEKVSKEAARIFKPAVMQRGQVDFDLPMVEAYYQAYLTKGIEPEKLPLVPEDDNYVYPTLKNGEPYVSDVSICNVFTCKVLRQAGIFGEVGEDINCGEFTVNDNYRLKISEDSFERPDICVQWDPENPLCQVLGKYQLRLDSQPGVLPRFNYVEPYAGFSNACPSLSPEYLAPSDC